MSAKSTAFSKALLPIEASASPETVSVLSFDQPANAPAPIDSTVLGIVSRSMTSFPANAPSLTAVMPAPNLTDASVGLPAKTSLPSSVTLSGSTSAVRPQSANALSPTVVTPLPSERSASFEQPSNAPASTAVTEAGTVSDVSDVHPLKLSAGTVQIEPSSTAASAGQSRNAFAPSVVPPSDTSVNPLAAKASSPMLFTLPSAISDSAAQPLNALSAIDATDEGSVTSARAEHPSNVLGPTAATPDGTTALASAVHPLKAPSAIDVVFSKRRIPPSFSLPASKAGNSAET